MLPLIHELSLHPRKAILLLLVIYIGKQNNHCQDHAVFTFFISTPLVNLHTSPAYVNPSDAMTCSHPIESLQPLFVWTYPELMDTGWEAFVTLENIIDLVLEKRDGFVSEYCINYNIPHNLPNHPNKLNQHFKYIELNPVQLIN